MDNSVNVFSMIWTYVYHPTWPRHIYGSFVQSMFKINKNAQHGKNLMNHCKWRCITAKQHKVSYIPYVHSKWDMLERPAEISMTCHSPPVLSTDLEIMKRMKKPCWNMNCTNFKPRNSNLHILLYAVSIWQLNWNIVPEQTEICNLQIWKYWPFLL